MNLVKKFRSKKVHIHEHCSAKSAIYFIVIPCVKKISYIHYTNELTTLNYSLGFQPPPKFNLLKEIIVISKNNVERPYLKFNHK